MRNALGQLLRRIKSLTIFPREMSDLEKIAFQAGYEAGLKGARNPYGRGTALHKAWESGYGERQMVESAW
jgi:hypothetical protein